MRERGMKFREAFECLIKNGTPEKEIYKEESQFDEPPIGYDFKLTIQHSVHNNLCADFVFLTEEGALKFIEEEVKTLPDYDKYLHKEEVNMWIKERVKAVSKNGEKVGWDVIHLWEKGQYKDWVRETFAKKREEK